VDLDAAEVGEEGSDCLAHYFHPRPQADQVIEQSNNKYKKSGEEQVPNNMEMLVDRKSPRRADEDENAQRPCIREHDRHTTYARDRRLVQFAVVVWPIHPTPTASKSSD
jgi:hypothetical protein